jgi:hypothetical protein
MISNMAMHMGEKPLREEKRPDERLIDRAGSTLAFDLIGNSQSTAVA